MEEEGTLAKWTEGFVVNEKFTDDFSGNRLNPTKWLPFYPGWHGRKEGRFVEENVVVENGLLKLTAQYEEETPAWFKASGYSNLTAACVRSCERVRYGYFETRFRANRSSMSNAFWLNGSLTEAEASKPGKWADEIDIFEVFEKSTKGVDHSYFTTAHRIATPYAEGRIMGALSSMAGVEKGCRSFADDFHVGALLWTPEKLCWFHDGRLVFERPNDHFHSAMHLVFDTEPLFAWSGEVNPLDLPATFEVEYVKVLQKREWMV